jgi:polysaccharide biosynthesis transport protein
LKANQIDMTNKEHEIAALKAKIDDYQRRLNEEPAREQQYADLTRGYEQSKANYDELLEEEKLFTNGHEHGIIAAGRTLSDD